MIRILGAITGSALALATLLVVIGIPQFKTESPTSEHTIVTLPLPTSPVEPGDRRTTGNAGQRRSADDDRVDAGAVVEADVPEPAFASPADDNAGVADSATGRMDQPVETGKPPPVELQPALDTPQSWYAFWSPFRSELAANGFVAQLQSVTGLDYRVVRVKPGVYEVAFAYQSNDDITASLTQITAATGLELPQ